MLATTLIILSLLGGKPSSDGCVDRCNSDMTRCSAPCGANQSCMDKCNKHSQRCLGGCVATESSNEEKGRAKTTKMPCGVDEKTKKVIPCTDKDKADMKESLKEAKGLCKDEEGNPTPCPGDIEKLKAKMKKMGVEMDCTDSSGVPIECPGNKQ